MLFLIYYIKKYQTAKDEQTNNRFKILINKGFPRKINKTNVIRGVQ